jgi:hypothetical protein
MPFWPFFLVSCAVNFVMLLLVAHHGGVCQNGTEKFWGSLISSLLFDAAVAVAWFVAKGLLAS